MGLEYHFDKNDGLIAKIFAALGMMFTQGMKDQENSSVDMAKTQEMNVNRSDTVGVTENKLDITTTTVKGNGIDQKELADLGKQNTEIKNSPTPTHENTLTF
jgi:hypothetical protein